MSEALLLLAIFACIAAAITVSIKRNNKGTLTLLLDSTQLSKRETVKGNVQIARKKTSNTEELVVELKCIETIQFRKEGEEHTEENTVYEEASTLVGITDHRRGNAELFPFEFTVPSKVDTADLADTYRKAHVQDDLSQHATYLYANPNAYTQRSNIFDPPLGEQCSYAQQSAYPQHSRYQSHTAHRTRQVDPRATNEIISSELQWQISAQLKSDDLDLEDKKIINLDVPNQNQYDGTYQY